MVGLDNLNDYYDVGLKEDRLSRLLDHPAFRFEKVDITDRTALNRVVRESDPDRVIHLAAQAGVRYSLENPQAYVDANITGFLNLLEVLRSRGTGHLVYASSSSVYGGSGRQPYSVHDAVDHPVSLYAVTKKSNELMAHAYSHLFGIPCTGLRFFTAYGPWGRPDVFNHGHHRRDFTYIDDVVEGVVRVLDSPTVPNPDWSSCDPDPQSSNAPYRLFNLGGGNPVTLLDFIEVLENTLGIEARRNYLPMQPGDVQDTSADVSDLVAAVGYRPGTSIESGVRQLVDWYRDYYGIAC